jgi:hypothetical protein
VSYHITDKFRFQTFFSTDVVKYQNDNRDNNNNNTAESNMPTPGNSNSDSYSSLALERWFEVTIPLTVVTFMLAFWWYNYAASLKQVFCFWRSKAKDPEMGY